MPLAQFLAGLKGLEYEPDQSIRLKIRAAEGDFQRLPGLADELVALAPDVIWTYSGNGARAAAGATATIPIVVGPVNEDAMAELVANFARPPGNITGVTLNSAIQHEKCLQLLKEAVPQARRIAVLINPANPTWNDYPAALAAAAAGLGLELVRVDAGGPIEIEDAIAAIAERDIDGVFTPADGSINSDRSLGQKLAKLLIEHGLPSVTDSSAFVAIGALMALTPDTAAIGEDAARYVDRILRGTKPSDLPVIRPSVVRVVINLQTAKALDFDIPASIMLRADEIIE